MREEMTEAVRNFQSVFSLKRRFVPRISRSVRSKVVYKASCWDCDDFYTGKTKRWLHDRQTEHFKTLTSNSHSSAIADHMTQTGHRIKGALWAYRKQFSYYSKIWLSARKRDPLVVWSEILRLYYFLFTEDNETRAIMQAANVLAVKQFAVYN